MAARNEPANLRRSRPESRPRRAPRRRLTRSADFERVYRRGRSQANRYLVVYAFPRERDADLDGPRLGVSVGRRVGGAVERNRVKRMLRESFRALAPELPVGHDFVVVARPDAGPLAEEQGQEGVRAALRELLPWAEDSAHAS